MPALRRTVAVDVAAVRRTRSVELRLKPLVLALAGALPLQALAQTMPKPPAINAVPRPMLGWRVVGSGAAAPVNTANARGGLDQVVDQSSQRAVYNWQSFDIGASSSVTFNLPDAGSSALNRVVGTTTPSRIFGSLRSTVPGKDGNRITGGELFLFNANGILFGQDSKVDVGSLIATTLSVRTDDYLGGLSSSIGSLDPSFTYTGAPELFDDRNFVRVDTGAQITTASGGRVFLFAKNVSNAGQISTPGGQTVLAAGSEVYLNDPSVEKVYASEANPSIPALRGLLVEVGQGNGSVTNSGSISVPRGNATLVGMAVNQLGRISATTSVQENGSVFLLARGNTTTSASATSNTEVNQRATTGGALTLGAGSRIEILPDATPGADGQPLAADSKAVFTASRIELSGQTIELQSGSQIHAPGAVVNLRAADTPDYTNPLTRSSFDTSSATARVAIDDSAVIDVAGTTDTQVSVARNFVTTELLGATDLRDAPLQRSGPLYRSKITFDLRKAVPILGDTTAYDAAIKRTAGEWLSQGGSINIESAGSVVTHKASSLDVSGGSVNYTAAQVNPTVLLGADGRRYGVNDAPADVLYTGIEGRTGPSQDRWGQVPTWSPLNSHAEAGYVEGRNAGSIHVWGRQVVLDGALHADAVTGERQATGTDPLAQRGAIQVGYGKAGAGTTSLGDFHLTTGGTALAGSFWQDPLNAPIAGPSRISADTLNQSGFGSFSVVGKGEIEQEEGADLQLKPKAVVALSTDGGGVTLQGSITSTGGQVIAQTADYGGEKTSGDVFLSNRSRIDVGGNWVNNALNPQPAAPAVAGGTVQLLSAHGLNLQDGSAVAVSGGATVGASGTVSGTAAGAIVLKSNTGANTEAIALEPMHLGATLAGYGINHGGSLTLRAAGVQISGPDGGAPLREGTHTGELQLTSDFFDLGGFNSFSIDGGASLTVGTGTTVAPRATTWAPNANSRFAATGAKPGSALTSAVLPDALRAPVNLELKASGQRQDGSQPDGSVSLAGGSTVQADPGAKISLSANANLDVQGRIVAPGGAVTLAIDGQGAKGLAETQGYEGTFNLGAHALLDVSGTTMLLPSFDGTRQGRMVNAGSINLRVSSADNQARQTTLVVDKGAELHADGAADAFDVQRLTPNGVAVRRETVVGEAGTIRIDTREGGARIAGQLQAHSADASVAGGQLIVSQPAGSAVKPQENGGVSEYRIELRNGELPSGTVDRGTIALSTSSFAGGGFADISLSSPQRIAFIGDVELHAQRNLSVTAAALSADPGATVRLSAPDTLQLAGGYDAAHYGYGPTGGTAALVLDGGQIALAGQQALQGVGKVQARANTAIVLAPAVNPETTVPSLVASGLHAQADVHLTAPQVVAATAADYALDVAGHAVTVDGGDAQATVPLYAGGHVTINADRIEQDGVLRAPMGEISLQAADALTLGAHSVTSVSAASSTVPYGTTSGGQGWTYLDQNVKAAPEKSIQLLAPGRQVEVKAGAVLDLSGGGTVVAHEFVPGPGGSVDAMAGAANGAFAVLPSVHDYAPFDAQVATEVDSAGHAASITPGRTIIFAPGGPIPAGTYALLPARYATLPGAFLVTPANARVSVGVTQARDDGSKLVGATLSSTGAAAVSAPLAFIVRTAEQAAKLSEIRQVDADTYAINAAQKAQAAVPRLAQDAGSLDIAASKLTLNGSVRFDVPQATEGRQAPRGGGLAIAADRIAVTDHAGRDTGVLYLSAATLQAVGAETITLGGVRGDTTEAGRVLNVSASDVLVDQGQALQARDVVIAATQSVTLAAGSSVKASGATAAADPLVVQGDGSLLRVSTEPQATTTRTDVQRLGGTLIIGANAQVSGASITAESTGGTTIADSAALQAQRFTVGAPRIAVGTADRATPIDASTLQLGDQLTTRLSQANQLTLRSFDSIDFYGDASIGSATQQSLTLDAGTLRVNGDGHASITAQGVTLTNTSGAFAVAEAGGGSLKVQAVGAGASAGAEADAGNNAARAVGDITVGSGAVALSGVAQSQLVAARSLVAQGHAELSAAGDLQLQGTTVTAGQRSDAAVSATGRLELHGNGGGNGDATSAATPGAGASLRLQGDSVLQAGTIALPSGHVTLHATGGDVTLAPGSITQVTGSAYQFDGQPVHTNGGAVTLTADAGNVALEAGAQVAASAGGRGARAGDVEVNAVNGRVTLGASLVSRAEADAGLGGALRIDASHSVDLDTLADTLAASSVAGQDNFGGAVAVRTRQGDLVFDGGHQLKSSSVALTADVGFVALGTVVDASGRQGGSISLAAGSDVLLNFGTRLDVHATESGHDGGRVHLNTSGGTLQLNAGSTIDARGAADAQDGHLLLRAPRVGTDVAVAVIDAKVLGSGAVDVEGVRVYNNITSLGTRQMQTAVKDANAFLGADGSNATAVRERLAHGDAALGDRLHLHAGVEMRSAGDMRVTGDTAQKGWNLTTFDVDGNPIQPGGEPIELTLRAGGTLNLQASLSDGFRSTGFLPASTDPGAKAVTRGGTIRLVGGADLSSADVLAVDRTVLNGDVLIGKSNTDVIVRTTTGDIDIAAGHDVKLVDRRSVVYTTGLPVDTAALPGFAAMNARDAYLRDDSSGVQSPFLAGGGQIMVSAGNDVTGAANGASQYVSEWWWRGTNATTPAAWWSRYDKFRQGFGTMGGGDVQVRAGNDANQVQVAAALSGYLEDHGDGSSTQHRFGGGNASVAAGHDVIGGLVMAAGERLDVRAGHSIAADQAGTATQAMHDDTAVRFDASGDVAVGRISAVQLLATTTQWTGAKGSDTNVRVGGTTTGASARIVSDAASVELTGNRPSDAKPADETLAAVLPSTLAVAAPEGSATVIPGSTAYQAPGAHSSLLLAARDDVQLGNLVVQGALYAMATPTFLPSSGGIRGSLTASPFGAAGNVSQSGDVQPTRIVAEKGSIQAGAEGEIEVATPLRMIAGGDINDQQGRSTVSMQHVQDGDLSLIRAGGSIHLTNDSVATGTSWTVHGPGQLLVLAGRDIDLAQSGGIGAAGNRVNGQLPDHSAKVTVIAGVKLGSGDYDAASARYFQLLGGAGAEDHAGDLAAQLQAMQAHAAIPAVGSPDAKSFEALKPAGQLARARDLVGDTAFDASMLQWVRVHLSKSQLDLAGAQAEVARLDERATGELAARVLADAWVQQVPASARTAAAVAWAGQHGNYAAALRDFLGGQGVSVDVKDLSGLLAGFDALAPEHRLLFINQVLASELRAAGRNASQKTGAARDAAYERGYQALATVFPAVADAADFEMGASQVKTLQGSAIDVLTPRGNVDVGQLTALSSSKGPSDLGVVTTGGGDLTMVVNDSVNVNRSRVFTVGKGDLLIWASKGNIDAGRGAKTVSGALPPVYRLVEGKVVVDTSGSYAGSGIAVLDASSTLDLYAPKGEINAGDAGIKSAGNAFFGAVRFVGADNLSIGGVAVGAPPPPPAAGGTSGLASLAQAATAAGPRASADDDEQERQRKRRKRLNLILDFIGFGEGAIAKPQ